MNREEFERLIEKYEAGTSSLSEEQYLVENAKNIDTTSLPWFRFIKLNRKKTPYKLNDRIWESIQNRSIKKRRITISILSAAASVILFILISVSNSGNAIYSYKKKEALLNEALNMFEKSELQNQSEQNLIYEDDMIIIYTALE